MSIMEVKNLTKMYGKFRALHQVNLTLKEGEVYGFIGPNGAGKTTAIRVMLGILKATEGNVTIFGKDAWKDAVDIHKRIAYVPGDVNLWSNLTGGEVIDFFVKLRGKNHENRRKELIDRFDLDPSKKCRTYSKGNRQKVALISAFAADADLYILDEPTSGLDPLMERVFKQCIDEVKKEGKSVFLSSHILSEVEQLCDKVSIIRQGEIIESGRISDLQHLTRIGMYVETKETVENLGKISGVHDLVKQKEGLFFHVDAESIDKVVRHISGYGVKKLESAPPTLEDLFMRYYEGEGGK